ncbi:MAG: hypothetical protein WCX31_10720 [Salinivirgaceae bacterium]
MGRKALKGRKNKAKGNALGKMTTAASGAFKEVAMEWYPNMHRKVEQLNPDSYCNKKGGGIMENFEIPVE